MEQFDNILNWRLLSGSHEFPGPDGGTCINEAAIIAAGFEYKKVNCEDDCPKCFSRPIAAYAIGVNDALPDERRQQLLPFVVRLAGTADTPDVERRRAEYLVIEVTRRCVALAFDKISPEHATALRAVRTVAAAYAAARAAWAAVDAAAAYAAARAAWAAAEPAAWAAMDAAAAEPAAKAAAYAAARAAYAAAYAAARAAEFADAAAEAAQVYSEMIAILGEVLEIGKKADPIETSLVVKRMEAAKVDA